MGGIIGGLLYWPSSLFILHVLKVDDVVDATVVHAVAGELSLHIMYSQPTSLPRTALEWEPRLMFWNQGQTAASSLIPDRHIDSLGSPLVPPAVIHI